MHSQFFTESNRIDPLVLVAEDGAASQDSQLWHERQAIDEAVGEAVAQVLEVIVLVDVGERKYGH